MIVEVDWNAPHGSLITREAAAALVGQNAPVAYRDRAGKDQYIECKIMSVDLALPRSNSTAYWNSPHPWPPMFSTLRLGIDLPGNVAMWDYEVLIDEVLISADGA